MEEIRNLLHRLVDAVVDVIGGQQQARKKKRKRKNGVIANIIAILGEATEAAPLTREMIWKRLCERFPDRDAGGMRVTVHSQVPLRLRKVNELDVQGSDDKGGYYIAG
jgi:hypothetical protein